MRNSVLLALSILAGSATTSLAQTTVSAPAGWTTQIRDGGARTFSPPDLRAGEKYSVTVYESAPMNGQSFETWLRAFGGEVGTKPGQLAAPLRVSTSRASLVNGFGAYNGPKGEVLSVVFVGTSFDGGRSIRVMRTLLAGPQGLVARYQNENTAIMKAMMERDASEAGDKMVRVPERVSQKMKPGGELLPGVYVGDQLQKGELINRFRLHLFPNGEYRLCGEDDKDIQTRGSSERVGKVSYNRVTGQLGIDSMFDLDNGYDYQFCFYGRDAANKPLIYSRDSLANSVTELRYVGSTKRLSPKLEKARAAAVEAEAKRFKWVVAPGRGVSMSQIETVVHDYQLFNYGAGMDVTDDAYLLLRDGTIYKGLPVAPDQLDVATSRQKEPTKWGKWRKTAGGYQVSWAGKPFEKLPGSPTVAGTPQMRLEGRFAAVRAGMNWHQFWGVTFDKAGRFSKDRRGGMTSGSSVPIEGSLGLPRVDSTFDDGGSGTVVTGGVSASSVRKNNPDGAREGAYSINGYTLTLRYDNGQIARLPFFFRDAGRKQLWFEFDTLELGLDG